MSRAKVAPSIFKAMLTAILIAASSSLLVAQEAPKSTRTSVARQRHDAASLAKGSQGWWLGTAVMVVILGAAGALCIAAKRQASGAKTGRFQVVGRVSLPPKHAVFMVRAGGRTLLIGTGPQGAPSLLGELDDDEVADAAAEAAPSGARFTAPPTPLLASAGPKTDASARVQRTVYAQPRFDVRLGDES